MTIVRLLACNAFCSFSDPSCVWTPFPNANAPGGVASRAADLATCQETCIATEYCIGIDIDQNSNDVYCWLTIVPQATGAMSPFANVIHYALTRNFGCPQYGELHDF
jgi:hypothetical protein